jgi:sugar/nucleoside kinase (ribokinase family)
VVWDPHPRGPAPILGATLLTPNESEATGLAGRTALPEALACALRDRWGSSGVAVTLGARGAVVAGHAARR